MSERYFEQDGKLIVQRSVDVAPAMERVRALKDATLPVSDSWLVGSVPLVVFNEWLKEAGVKWDDPAAKDVLKRKLMDGDFNKFRVKQGSY